MVVPDLFAPPTNAIDNPPSGRVPPMSDLGISGTTNRRGDLFSEYNAKLYHQAGFGQPGSRIWGQWEYILRTDPDIASAMEFSVAKVRDARLSFLPGGPSALEIEQARFVEWNFKQALEPGWATLAQQIVTGMLGFGFSIHEFVAEACYHPSLPGGRGWKLGKLLERLPVSLHWNAWLEEHGDLVGIRQRGVNREGEWEDVVLPAERVQLCSWNRSGGNYAGFPQTRSVWYLATIREQLLKLTGISAIREGAGLPIARAEEYAELLDKEQRDQMFTTLSNLVGHEAAAVVMPKGWTVEWIYSPGADKGGILDLWHRLGLTILQLFQAQQLALGTSDTGSRAVGEVHAGSSGSFIKGVTSQIEATFNGRGTRAYEGIIRKIVDWNWGPQRSYPRLKIDVQPPQLRLPELITALKDAVEAGLITPDVQVENNLRDQLGWEAIDEQTRAMGQAAMAPPPPAPFGAPAGPVMHAALPQPWQPWRPLRPTERLLDLARMDSFLNRARQDFETGAKPLVVEMLTRALPDVRAAMVDGDPSEISNLQMDSSRLEAFIGEFIEKARAEGYAQVRREYITSTGDEVAKDRAEGDQTFAPIRHAAPDPSTRVADALEARKRLLARRMVARLREAMEAKAIEVIRTGGEASDVVTGTVMDQLESGGLKSDGGSVLTTAWNMGREEFAEEHGDEVESVELSAILDSANCEPCADLDGEEFEFGSDEHYAHTPPLTQVCDGGDRCRCVLIYNFKNSTRSVE